MLEHIVDSLKIKIKKFHDEEFSSKSLNKLDGGGLESASDSVPT